MGLRLSRSGRDAAMVSGTGVAPRLPIHFPGYNIYLSMTPMPRIADQRAMELLVAGKETGSSGAGNSRGDNGLFVNVDSRSDHLQNRLLCPRHGRSRRVASFPRCRCSTPVSLRCGAIILVGSGGPFDWRRDCPNPIICLLSNSTEPYGLCGQYPLQFSAGMVQLGLSSGHAAI